MAVSPVERPLFAKEGEFLPFVEGGQEGFGLQHPYNYGLISNFMAQGKKTFKKRSYRVNKRILERTIRSKYDLLGLIPILSPVRELVIKSLSEQNFLREI